MDSPCPMRAPVRASLALPKPSSLQTTLADCRFQRSSHTVPHSLSLSTSTRPSPSLAPPFSLTLLYRRQRHVTLFFHVANLKSRIWFDWWDGVMWFKTALPKSLISSLSRCDAWTKVPACSWQQPACRPHRLRWSLACWTLVGKRPGGPLCPYTPQSGCGSDASGAPNTAWMVERGGKTDDL